MKIPPKNNLPRVENKLTQLSSQELSAFKELDSYLKSWISTSNGRREFIASMGFLLTACASSPPKTRYREGDNSGQTTEISVNDEVQMTQEVLPQMKKDYPALQNPEIQSYVSGLGQKIVRTNGLIGNPYQYTFTAVGVNQVNAFALPAGTVFVTAPLIAMADSEAELAGVIGHEVGHVKARHAAERMDKARAEQSNSWKYAVGGGLLGGAIGYGLGKLLCPPSDKKCANKAAELGVAAGVGGGLLIQKYGFMANSREDEMEADRIGFRTSYVAGYNKDHVGLFYAKLLNMEKQRKQSADLVSSVFGDALSTHPPSQERVNQMNELANMSQARSNAVVSTKEFDRAKKICQEWMRLHQQRS